MSMRTKYVRVVLKLPDVKRKSGTRPKKCRYCQGETFQR
jgi:hypothetical protein